MAKILLPVCLLMMVFSIITFSCVDHSIPSNDPVIETGYAGGVGLNDGIDMNFRLSFKDLGSKGIVEYGISYIPYTTDVPNDEIYIDNPGVLLEKFTAPYPAILGEVKQSHAKFPYYGAIYYRAYVITADKYVFYGEKKFTILPK
ncbi:hypothetical protein [Dyadobacter sp. CY326]|uniref:hypothetical protein n=1 Tax=Dyadobacter sp. CY326 TaxID=2907300 RepID=UPI001F46744B|nr:hypothetical protein [Dyadobacter sp. CY326]MCE7065185.1 hypothetical protein [Dyadobacter sp. CY326]